MERLQDMNPAIRRITLWGMSVNILLTICKIVIGILAKSQSCVADGVHSLSDFLTDIVVLVGIRFWMAPADFEHPHGHQRIEALVTLFIGLLLGAGAIGMAYKALLSVHYGVQNPLPGWPVFVIALLSVLLKEYLYQRTLVVGHETHSSAVVANAWHHRSDALSSIPVVLVAILGHFWPNITILDPIAAILVSALLLHSSWTIVWPCLKELSDVGVSADEIEKIRQLASSVSGVVDVHEIRTRRIGSGLNLDMHILVNRDMTVEAGHRICEEVTELVQRKMPVVLDVLTHLEPEESVDVQEKIAEIARQIPGVKSVHGIRIRTVLNGYDADLHVMVAPEMSVRDGHAICQQVEAALVSSPWKISRVLTHLEPMDNPLPITKHK